ncbi:MAG: lamin tail domain-containing protein [Alistipes sp.]|nr:lamin tail domain-containing protein [Alistipes sp.]
MRRLILILLVSLLGVAAGSARTHGLRINEVLVKNVDNYVDDYGHRSSWIELHNTSHSTVDLGGYYLRVVANGVETLYRIPSGDPRTKVSPLGYIIFFCEGTGTKGTLYTNFTLEDVESIALLSQNGSDVIDQIEIDYAAQRPDVSVGYMTTAQGDETFMALPRTTPNATNDTEPVIARHERFRQMDPHGIVMAVSAVTVVITVLATLFIFFKLLGNYMISVARRREKASKAKAAKTSAQQPQEETGGIAYSGDEIAAIAMALQMYFDELHDRESSVLTINRVARAYSPWSSKIYGLRQFTKK